jgi:hypothetical protein
MRWTYTGYKIKWNQLRICPNVLETGYAYGLDENTLKILEKTKNRNYMKHQNNFIYAYTKLVNMETMRTMYLWTLVIQSMT